MKENTQRVIEYPGVGMTPKPPWGAFIVLGNKRHENRGLSEAGVARKWIGQRIAITASKNFCAATSDAEIDVIQTDALWMDTPKAAKRMIIERLSIGRTPERGMLSDWNTATAGKIIGVADLLEVVRNGDDPPGYWQASGQHSLVLGRVWEVEPVPCTGGQGVWKLSRCPLCGRTIANTYGTKCNRCAPGLTYPAQLTVNAEYGADGEELWRAA